MVKIVKFAVADPGFPIGEGVDLVGGCGLPRQLRFENFVCQNERIGTLSGGAHRVRPLDPPMICMSKQKNWDPLGASGAPPGSATIIAVLF